MVPQCMSLPFVSFPRPGVHFPLEGHFQTRKGEYRRGVNSLRSRAAADGALVFLLGLRMGKRPARATGNGGLVPTNGEKLRKEDSGA
jgi:hypothetical protein